MPNAIDESIYLSNFDARCSKEIYLKTQLSTKGVKILYQGVILEERDLDTLVLATSLLNKKIDIPDFEVIIIGAGPYLENLKDLVNSLNLDQKIMFLGRIPYEKLANYTQIADVYFISAKDTHFWEISFPNKFTEYMCISKPIIAADFKSWKKLGGEAFFYFKREDPVDLAVLLEKILTKPQLLDEKIPLIQDVYRKNRWETVSEELEKCYASLDLE